MLCSEIIAVCSQIHTKHTMQNFLILHVVVHIVTILFNTLLAQNKQIRVPCLTWPTLFPMDGFRPSQVFFPTLTHSLSRQKTRGATPAPSCPPEGTSQYYDTKTHPARLAQRYCLHGPCALFDCQQRWEGVAT
jgi:hypothetical protein